VVGKLNGDEGGSGGGDAGDSAYDLAAARDSTVGDGILRTRESDGSDGSGTKCYDPNQIDGFAGVHARLGARRRRRLEQATEGRRRFGN